MSRNPDGPDTLGAVRCLDEHLSRQNNCRENLESVQPNRPALGHRRRCRPDAPGGCRHTRRTTKAPEIRGFRAVDDGAVTAIVGG